MLGSGDILVAEDSRLLLQLLRDALVAHGIGSNVVAFADGVSLLIDLQQRLQLQGRAELYLLDIVMPDLSGLEVAHRIRQLERTQGAPPAPILLYSTRKLDDEILQVVEQCWPARFVQKQPGARADKLALVITRMLSEVRDAGS